MASAFFLYQPGFSLSRFLMAANRISSLVGRLVEELGIALLGAQPEMDHSVASPPSSRR
jgi:hypothetical protein